MSASGNTLAYFLPKDAQFANPQTRQASLTKIGNKDVLQFKNGLPSTRAYFEGVLPRSSTNGFTSTTGIKVLVGWRGDPTLAGKVKWAAAWDYAGQTDLLDPTVDNFAAIPATIGNIAANEVATSTTANATTVGGMNYTLLTCTLANIENSNAITGATNANPIVITTTGNHGFSTGQVITVASVGGNTNANQTSAITVLSPTTFSIAVAGNAAYTSGGTASPYATAPAVGDHFRLRIRRVTEDTTNDTLAGIAYLCSVELYDY